MDGWDAPQCDGGRTVPGSAGQQWEALASSLCRTLPPPLPNAAPKPTQKPSEVATCDPGKDPTLLLPMRLGLPITHQVPSVSREAIRACDTLKERP